MAGDGGRGSVGKGLRNKGGRLEKSNPPLLLSSNPPIPHHTSPFNTLSKYSVYMQPTYTPAAARSGGAGAAPPAAVSAS